MEELIESAFSPLNRNGNEKMVNLPGNLKKLSKQCCGLHELDFIASLILINYHFITGWSFVIYTEGFKNSSYDSKEIERLFVLYKNSHETST